MSFSLVTPPQPILDLEGVKRHLRVIDYTGDDALIDELIEAATSHIDGPEAWLGRCLGPQTWDWKLDASDAYGRSWSEQWVNARSYIQVPIGGRIISIDSITYLDSNGDLQSWTDYDVFGLNSTVSARIQPKYRSSWPSVLFSPEAVTVRFTGGYQKSNGESPPKMIEAVPWSIKAALRQLIGDLYKNRETSVDGHISQKIDMSATVEALLNPYRTWSA